jgi:hypothetical protein
VESWRITWRRGVEPCLSVKALEALRDGLARDDPKLLQGATTSPPPLSSVQDWPVEAACFIGYAVWHGDGLSTVGDVECKFAEVCFECDKLLGEPAGVRWFLNWADDAVRADVLRELLPEVDLAIANRRKAGS